MKLRCCTHPITASRLKRAARAARAHAPVRTALAWAACLALWPAQGPALAQGTVLPAATVPVLRGVVAGRAIVQDPVATPTGQRLVIEQQDPRIVIDWKRFDIGSGSEVRFNQPSATAAALNRIYSADPSLIQGKLSANGQVYLINQNGILFDRGSQVNVGALVASTLNIANRDFLEKSLTAGGTTTPAFAGGYAADGNGSTDPAAPVRGAIRIGAGGPAGAPAPQLSATAGGNILMFAPVVDNQAGVIQSPDGQVILAAGSKVYLTDANPDLQALRGLVVEVSADNGPVDLTSLVRNLGTVSADRGNVTLAGLAIHHAGRVSASTAVLYNGSVYLKAASSRTGDNGGLVADRAGTVRIDAGALVATPLDTTDTATLPESQAYASVRPAEDRRGVIRISGLQITQEGRVEAPGGKIEITAAKSTGNAEAEQARVYLGASSTTTAAGAWADVSASGNLVTFRVTGNELKDSPLQKDGALRGQTVTVDLRQANPLLDLSGYRDSRARSVAEKAAAGGQIDITSSGSVVARQGSVVDVSGGGYRFGPTQAALTQLLGDDGRVYDIGSAPKDRVYTALLDTFTKRYERWGQTRVWNTLTPNLTVRQPQRAGVEGLAGGALTLAAPSGMVLDGRLLGGATIGVQQLAAAPRGGRLVIGTEGTTPPVLLGAIEFSAAARDSLGTGFAPDAALPDTRASTLTLAAGSLYPAAGTASANAPALPMPAGTLAPQRFGSVEINAAERVALPAAVAIDAGAGNSLALRGRQVDIDGRISSAGGSVVLVGRAAQGAAASEETPRVTLGAQAALDTAGLWINRASVDGAAVGAALPSVVGGVATTQGGSVSVLAPRVVLREGSVIDVSGGGSVARGGRISGGNAGAVTLAVDSAVGAAADSRFDGDFRAFSIGSGGTLSVALPNLLIGAGGGGAGSADYGYRFGESGFDLYGFQRFSLTGARGLSVTGGTLLEPEVLSWVVDGLAAAALTSGSRLADIATRARLPAAQQRSTSVALRTTDRSIAEATLSVQPGARIQTTPGGSITLSATAGLDVQGTLAAPAGQIALTLDGPATQRENTLRLGAGAALLAEGTTVLTPNDAGLRQGSVSGGGQVRLDARNGRVVAEAGSRINVDGADAVFDLAPPGAPQPGRPTVATRVARDAGGVFVRAEDGIDFRATASGRAAAGSAGGSFAMELTQRDSSLEFPDLAQSDRRIVLTQAPSTAATTGTDAVLAVNALAAAGFDKLRLQSEGAIEGTGAVQLEFARGVRLDTPELRVADGTRNRVAGASVVLANSFGRRPAVGSAIDNTEASRTVATRAGTGVLRVEADTLDLLGDLTINGAGSVELAAARDIRMSGRTIGSNTSDQGALLRGSLTTSADLTLRAAQAYPTTLSSFTIAVEQRDAQGATTLKADGVLTIAGNGNTPGAVLSAGGSATLRADRLNQQGVLRAPTGRLALDGASALELGRDSVTSVSAAGSTVPFGGTESGVSWLYSATNATATKNDLKAPPDKRITLAGSRVVQQPGATVDLSGGGSLLATEFVPGSGGSRDVLLQADTYAILPAAMLSSMPVDRHINALQDTGSGLLTAQGDRAVYDSVVIGPGAAVPAGEYVLLPGRYALLPGAFVVQLQTASAYRNLAPGQTVALPNGQTVVAARRSVSGTAVREAQTVGVIVRAGGEARKESDYNLVDTAFFAALAERDRRAAPALPADAGALQIAATQSLKLDGNLRTAPADGKARIAEIDITGSRIAVVGAAQAGSVPAGTLAVDADSLSRLNGSVLIGGTRSRTAEGTRITASAATVRVDIGNGSGTTLRAPELILVAADEVRVARDSVVSAEGTALAGTTAGVILADAGGALLRVAAAGASDAPVNRGGSPDPSRGTLVIEAGARIAADGALTADATRDTRIEGRLAAAPTASVALAAGRMLLGDAPANTPAATSGLALDNSQLVALAGAKSLSLKSYERIELLGAARVGSDALKTLTLDTPLLQAAPGAGSGAARIAAQELRLVNSSAAQVAAGSGSAALVADAGRIVSGAGDRAISGFGGVELKARGDIALEGAGSLRVGGALTTQSARITGASGAAQTWRAADDSASGAPVAYAVTLGAGAGAGAAPADAVPHEGLGARLEVQGSRVTSAARMDFAAGAVALTAQGGDVKLTSTARIDVGGVQRSFNGATVSASAGQITLTADGGQVQADSGSTLRLDAAAGSDAGRLVLRGDVVALAGTATALAQGRGAGGRVAIDTRNAAEFGALNQRLDAGGFSEAREFRFREGDVNLAAGQTISARRIAIAADGGKVEVAGTLDSRSSSGAGRIDVYAAGDLRLTDGARIASGGAITLDSRDGTLSMAPNAEIELRDGARTGSATFVARRGADNTSVATDLRGSVFGARAAGSGAPNVVVQGRRSYDGSDDSARDSIAADHAAFIAGADRGAVLGGLKGTGGTPLSAAVLQGAAELRSTGDLAINQRWDLTRSDWLAGGVAGTLTLRAAGSVILGQSVGLPDDNAPAGATWNLRLAGGADLSAANPLATLATSALAPGAGDVVLATADAKLRSGTGSIDITAARDFRIDNDRAVIYTTGVAAAPNPQATATAPNPASGVDTPWATGGGSIRISAGRDAVGGSDQWITDWYRRPRGATNVAQQSGWWAYRPNFRQNVATFGGGDIEISAGRDIDQLSAMSAASGRAPNYAGPPAERTLEVRGGGDVSLRAGRDVMGGEVLVSRGRGLIGAGGSVGTAARRTQLYLMGETGGADAGGASLDIQAGDSLRLQSIDNPTALGLTTSRPAAGAGSVPNLAPGGTFRATFYTYAPSTSVNGVALGGDVVLGLQPLVKPVSLASDGNVVGGPSSPAAAVLPPQVSLAALTGSITGAESGPSNRTVGALFPSTIGQLRLLAGTDVSGLSLTASDQLPASLSTWQRLDSNGKVSAVELLASDPRLSGRAQTVQPAFDVQAAAGDVRDVQLQLPGRSRVQAGRDVVGGGIDLQNLAATDLSVIKAERGDIRPASRIQIDGPGQLLIQAGRNATLQNLVQASGNVNNPSLPTGQSARLTIVAGVQGDVDLAKLDQAYADLIEAGKAQDTDKAKAAMAAFYGSAKLSAGDIDTFRNSVQTFGGSDIDLLAPRGNVTVGLTTPQTGFVVGNVTNAGGAIRSQLQGNFNINSGKVVTAQGGDILIFANEGNIDAGRGARTSVTTPAPRRVPILGEGGVVIGYRFVLSGGVAGSGIQTVSSDPDGPGPLAAPKAGDVFLFAPAGFVDAGEAGIASGANIFIAAQLVLNAANISAQGSSSGVPVATAGSLASSLATSGSANSGGNKAAEEAASAAASAAKAAAAADAPSRPAILQVEVLGFGERNCKENQKDCFAK